VTIYTEITEFNGYILFGAVVGNKNGTAVTQWGNSYIEEFPVILHPVYFVATTGNDANTGYLPTDAWLTLKKVTTNKLVTAGSRVRILPGEYEELTGASTLWDTGGYPGTGVSIIEGTTSNPLDTQVYLASGSASAYLFALDQNNRKVLFRHLRMYSAKASANTFLTISGKTGQELYLRDAYVGNKAIDSLLIYPQAVGCKVDIEDSYLTTGATQGTVRISNNMVIRLVHSILNGGGASYKISGNSGVTGEIYNNTFVDYATYGVRFDNGTSHPFPTTKNNIFVPRAGATADISDGGTRTETDAVIDYNCYGGTVENLANSGGSHSLTSCDPLFRSTTDFRLRPSSPAINAE
jgi:hypothetical protein